MWHGYTQLMQGNTTTRQLRIETTEYNSKRLMEMTIYTRRLHRLFFLNMMVIFFLILCSRLHYSLHTKIQCYIIIFGVSIQWPNTSGITAGPLIPEQIQILQQYFGLGSPNISKYLDPLGIQLFQRGAKYFITTLQYMDQGVQIYISKHLDRGKLISWQIWLHMCLHVHNYRSITYW